MMERTFFLISDSRLAKNMWKYKPKGHRFVDRFQKRWLEDLWNQQADFVCVMKIKQFEGRVEKTRVIKLSLKAE